MSWGIRPAAMIGHSMGEYTAAYLAGVFSLGDAIALVTLRGRLFETLPEGAMLGVPMSEAELRELLPPELSIAAVNAPGLCVASGPVDAIAALERQLAARDVDTRRVRIAVAAHSAMLAPILDEFGAFFRRIAMRPPAIPFVSNLSGGWITAAEATDPGYWVRHLRNTVRFADGVRELMRESDRILLEVGPGRTLATLAKQQLGKSAQLVQSSMRHPDDADSDVAFQLGALGRLWAAGATVDWAGFRGDEHRLRVPLPTYPFERQRHWIDAEARPEARAPRAAAGDGRAELAHWFSVPSWTRKPPRQAAVAADVAQGAAVLLLADAEGMGDRLAARMRARGQHVTVVRAGTAFERRSEGEIAVNPRAPEDFEGLVAALAAQGDLPRRIVHCWNVGADAGGEPLDRLAREEAHGFYSLLFLAQALGREDALNGVELDVLSTGMQRIAGERWLAPAKALLLGPCRVLPQEFEGLRCRSIDFALPDGADAWRADAVAERLLAELDAANAEPVVAYRGRDRWVPSLEPTPLADAPRDAAPLRERGVYLLTGGLGGMGLTIAEYLARAVRARLVLVGRSAMPAREEWSRWLETHDATDRTSVVLRDLLALESLGAEVMPASADVTDREQMARVVARARDRFGAIHGVVHAAGVLDDGLAQLKSPESAARVLAPKVRGTLVLDEALGGEPLDFFALCSSISAIAGLAGQVDYAAANAFLDAFAAARAERSAGLTIALGWSAWRDVGMAAALAGGGGAAPGAEPGAHPLIGRRLFSVSDEAVFATEMGVDTHWLLAEHRIREGHALIPGTGHLEIARAAFEHGAGPSAFELRDVAFLSPFVVHDGERKELRVHLRREGALSRFVIAGRIGDAQGGGWEEHVVGTAARPDAVAPRVLDLAAVRARCGVREEVFDGGEESEHLAFGPRWKNLRRVCYGAREALATLEIPAEFAGDLATFRLHPSLLDMATACAQALIEGFDARRDFYVPLSYTRVRAHGALPARVHSHIRLREGDLDPREIAVFDVTIVDDAGVEIVDIAEFMMRRVDGRDQMSDEGSTRAHPARRSTVRFDPPAARPASPVVPGLESAIAPAEGVEAFRRVLAAAPGSQVLISPEPVETAIARLRAPVPRALAATADAAGVADVDFSAIEEALVSHDAVREAAVLARADRAGDVRLVAYVVYDAAEHVTVSDLRRYLKDRLADSSVPSNFVGLDAMPVTADGAVDRGALPDPFGAADDYVAPATEMEQVIAGIWKEVLGIERVSRHDNFFDIGGHSLLAVRVVTRIDKRAGVRLSQAIMVLQTLEQIAAECEKRRQPADQAPPVAAPDTIGRKLLNVFKQSVMQS
jgi:acyl transferase domain-containing protein